MKLILFLSLLALAVPGVAAANVHECAEGACVVAASFGSCDAFGGNVARGIVDRPEATAELTLASVCSENVNGVGVYGEAYLPPVAARLGADGGETYSNCYAGIFLFAQVPTMLGPFHHAAGCPVGSPPQVPVLP